MNDRGRDDRATPGPQRRRGRDGCRRASRQPSWCGSSTSTWPAIQAGEAPDRAGAAGRLIRSWPRSSSRAWPASSSSTGRPARRPEPSRRCWASSGSSASSAGAAWASSTRPSRPRSAAAWRSRSCGSASWPTRRRCSGSGARPRPSPGCTTPTSCRSSPSAASAASHYYAMQFIEGRSLADVLDGIAASRHARSPATTSPAGASRRPRPWPMPTSAG